MLILSKNPGARKNNLKVVNHGCLPEQRRAQLGDGQGSAEAETPWPTLGQAKQRKIKAIHCLEFTL